MLHYEVDGPTDAPALLLLHGFMSSNAQWDLNTAALSKQLRLVKVELMGHGSSPTPLEPEPYRLPSTLEYLETIREDLGISSWTVGGHSMGGATTIRYAMAHPEVCDGVVFTNTRAAFALARTNQDDVFAVSATPEELRALPYHPIHAKRFPEDLKAKMVAIADHMNPYVLQQVITNRPLISSVDDLHTLTVPATLINGRFERAFQPCVDLATQALPELEIVNLDGGHSVNVEAPDAFDDAVLSFVLERLS